MSIIKVKCKVKLYSESDMELMAMDIGTFNSKSAKWLTREQGIPAADIYLVTAHSKEKTVISMYNGDVILAYEPFYEVFNKWKEAMKEVPKENTEQTEEEEEKEEDED